MKSSAFREYGALVALCTSGSLNLLLPLYLSHLGYPVAVVGLLAGIGAMATFLSHFPVPFIYRPHRSRQLLIGASLTGAATSAVLPLCTDIVLFTAVLVVNRVLSGFAATVIMARFMDLMEPGTDRRRAMGWFGGTQAVGYSLASLFVGLLVDYVSYSAGFLYGAGGSLVAAALLFGRPNPQPAAVPSRTGQHTGGLNLAWWRGLADPGLWRILNASSWNNVFHNVQTTFFPVLALAMGLSASEVGGIRAAYAAVNAVGRPLAGFVLAKLTVRQASIMGITAQSALLAALPFMPNFPLLAAFSLFAGAGRAVVVVATSAGLAEDVDETRVSRGTATAAYSTTNDLAQVGAPLVAGAFATALSLTAMFPLMAGLTLAVFLVGDNMVERWKRATIRAAEPALTS
jgi:MFS family permease